MGQENPKKCSDLALMFGLNSVTDQTQPGLFPNVSVYASPAFWSWFSGFPRKEISNLGLECCSSVRHNFNKIQLLQLQKLTSNSPTRSSGSINQVLMETLFGVC